MTPKDYTHLSPVDARVMTAIDLLIAGGKYKNYSKVGEAMGLTKQNFESKRRGRSNRFSVAEIEFFVANHGLNPLYVFGLAKEVFLDYRPMPKRKAAK